MNINFQEKYNGIIIEPTALIHREAMLNNKNVFVYCMHCANNL